MGSTSAMASRTLHLATSIDLALSAPRIIISPELGDATMISLTTCFKSCGDICHLPLGVAFTSCRWFNNFSLLSQWRDGNRVKARVTWMTMMTTTTTTTTAKMSDANKKSLYNRLSGILPVHETKKHSAHEKKKVRIGGHIAILDFQDDTSVWKWKWMTDNSGNSPELPPSITEES